MAKTTINGDNVDKGQPVKRIRRGERTAIALYDRLWDVLDGLDDNLEASKANAFANVTGKIMGLAKLQMEHSKMTGQPLNIPMLGSGTRADEQAEKLTEPDTGGTWSILPVPRLRQIGIAKP